MFGGHQIQPKLLFHGRLHFFKMGLQQFYFPGRNYLVFVEIISLKNISKGGYILIDEKQPDVILIGTGSEVKLAVSAGEELKSKYGIKSRIVSMPSTTIFDQQSRVYKEKVVPNHLPKMIIEAGVTDYWWKYKPDVVLGIDKFGESAPEEDVFEAFGISSRTIVDSVLCLLRNDRNNLRG